MRASLLVLNYNGLRLLEGCFDTLGAATRRDATMTLPVDNGSTDESLAYTQTRYPWVRNVRAPRNAFLFTYNDIVPTLDTEAVLLQQRHSGRAGFHRAVARTSASARYLPSIPAFSPGIASRRRDHAHPAAMTGDYGGTISCPI